MTMLSIHAMTTDLAQRLIMITEIGAFCLGLIFASHLYLFLGETSLLVFPLAIYHPNELLGLSKKQS